MATLLLKIPARFLSILKTKLALFHRGLQCPSSPDSCRPLKLISCHLHTPSSRCRTCFRCYTLSFAKVNMPCVSHDLTGSLLLMLLASPEAPYVSGSFLRVFEIQLQILQRNCHASSGWLEAFSLCPFWLIFFLPIKHLSLNRSRVPSTYLSVSYLSNLFSPTEVSHPLGFLVSMFKSFVFKRPKSSVFKSNLIANLNVMFSFQLPSQLL